jgi:hypothetical protein
MLQGCVAGRFSVAEPGRHPSFARKILLRWGWEEGHQPVLLLQSKKQSSWLVYWEDEKRRVMLHNGN